MFECVGAMSILCCVAAGMIQSMNMKCELVLGGITTPLLTMANRGSFNLLT